MLKITTDKVRWILSKETTTLTMESLLQVKHCQMMSDGFSWNVWTAPACQQLPAIPLVLPWDLWGDQKALGIHNHRQDWRCRMPSSRSFRLFWVALMFRWMEPAEAAWPSNGLHARSTSSSLAMTCLQVPSLWRRGATARRADSVVVWLNSWMVFLSPLPSPP